MIRSCSLKSRLLEIDAKETIYSYLFAILELGDITKHLMTGPAANSEFCFPLDLNVLLGFTSGNIEGLELTKLTVSLGASH